MATVEKLVTRALRLIQVIDVKQPVKAADMQTGIEALNAMLTRWEANGLALGWQDVDNPSQELPLPKEAEQSVAYALAVTLAPEYGVEPMAAVVAGATNGLTALLRDQAVATPIMPILSAPIPDTWNQWGTDAWGQGWWVG